MKTKKYIRKNKPVSISLSPDLCEKIDAKAKAQYQDRSEYIKNLIIFDLGLISLNNSRGGTPAKEGE